ncbi:MAG: hypothetical protein F6K58_17370 [Symploca sp. SIO2E9]|nr:hypothetical protein [Symploca sp. SIO2E9]
MSIETRNIRYAVVPVEKLRAINPKTDQEVIAAQKTLDQGTIEALEEMINAAKAGRLEDNSVLSLRAAAWA